MFLHNLGRGLLRRWYVVFTGILLTAGGGMLIWNIVPPSYQATSTVVLLPPSSLVGEGNPYLYMGGLEQVLTVLNVRLNSTEVANSLIQGRGDLKYVVEKDLASPGPLMLVTATGKSQDGAMSLLREVVQAIPSNLTVMQDQLRIPTFSRVQVMTVVQDHSAVLLIKEQLRMLIAAVAGGLALTVLVTALLDRVMTSRSNRRAERHIQLPNQIPALVENPETWHVEAQSAAGMRPPVPSERTPTVANGARARDQKLEVPASASSK